jgi:hypothetical protein
MLYYSMKKYYHKYKKYNQKILFIQKGGIEDDNNIFTLQFNEKKRDVLNRYGINVSDPNFQQNTLFRNLSNEVKTIGQPSVNGTVKLLNYELGNRNFKTILKISTSIDADNSNYEYLAGLSINFFKNYFPNFLYTFAYVKFNNTNNTIDNYQTLNGSIIKNNTTVNVGITKNQTDLKEGCNNNDKSGVLIEFINNALTFDDFIQEIQKNYQSANIELYNLLFQIYMALFSLRDNFTHYDLHTGNVMIISLKNPHKISYTLKNKTYVILTRYLPVIIDYGRCYFRCDELRLNSTDVIRDACKTNCNYYHPNNKQCNLTVRGLWGIFDEFGVPQNDINNFFINTRTKNESHDLRYIYLIIRDTNLQQYDIIAQLKNHELKYLFSEVRYGSNGLYGLPEDNSPESGLLNNIESCKNILLSYHDNIYNQSKNIYQNIFAEINIDCNMINKWRYKQERYENISPDRYSEINLDQNQNQNQNQNEGLRIYQNRFRNS